MSFQIQRISEKLKSQFSNEDGSSPISQLEDQEIDDQSMVFGDIVKKFERVKKKKPTIQNFLKSSPKKLNPPDLIKLSLDKKKCQALFEKEKLFEFSQRSLNPTQYMNYKKKQQQNGSPTPTPKKHSNKVMPEPKTAQNGSNNSSEILTQSQQLQKNQNAQISPLVIASIIKLQQEQEVHVSQLDKIDLDQFLSQAMQNQHLNSSIKKDLKIALERKLISQHHYRQFFLVGTNAQVMIHQNQGYYQALLKQRDQYPPQYFDKIKQNLSKINQNIQQDVCRSFGNVQNEQKRINEEQLDNILSAIAIRNPYIHYCQGMNYIAVFILKYITNGNEEETFWIFVQLLESFLSLEMYNNYDFFPYYFNMLEEYLKIEFSDLYEKLKKHHVQQLSFPFSEMFTLFSNQIKPQITIQIWINLILQGQRALFKSIITLLNIFRVQLSQADDFGSIHKIIDQIKQYDNQAEFQSEYDKYYINKRAFMQAFNKYSEEQRFESQGNKKNQLGLSKINQKCNLQSPICFHVQQTIKLLNRSFSYFIYKTAKNIEVTYPDYFSADKSQNDFNQLHSQNQAIQQESESNQGIQQQQKQESTQQQIDLNFNQSPKKQKQQNQQNQNLADFEKQIVTDSLDNLLVGRFYHMCQNKEIRQNGSILKSTLSPARITEKSQFRSPQFLSLKKVNIIENDDQINQEDESLLDAGTDPFPVFKQTTSVLSHPNREKSKTHFTVSNLESSNNIEQRKKEFTFYNQNYIIYHKNEQEQENGDDQDGDLTDMFNNKKKQGQSPKRRKSITLHDEGQVLQSSASIEKTIIQNQSFSQSGSGHSQNQEEQDQNDDSPMQIRERSNFILLKRNKNDQFTIQLPAYTQQCIKVMNNGVEQKILKY